nr:MAG TPA: hypothetical protein [Caudoviricetes sp.]
MLLVILCLTKLHINQLHTMNILSVPSHPKLVT